MVSLSSILASNKRISETLPPGLVAIFIGATSGIGEYTLKCFAKRAVSPRVYLVGRSLPASDRIIAECKTLNPDGAFTFIQADISLIRTVDEVCRQIKKTESTVNILFMTQGSLRGNYRTWCSHSNPRNSVSVQVIRSCANIIQLHPRTSNSAPRSSTTRACASSQTSSRSWRRRPRSAAW